MAELICGYCGLELHEEDTAEGRERGWKGHVKDCPERPVVYAWETQFLPAVEGEAVEAVSPARTSVEHMGKNKKPKKQAAPSPANGANGEQRTEMEQFKYDLVGDISQAVGLAVKGAIEAAGGVGATAPQVQDDDDAEIQVVDVSEDEDGDEAPSKASRYRDAVKAGKKAMKSAKGKPLAKQATGYTEFARLLLADEDFAAKNEASIQTEDGSTWKDYLLHLSWRRQAAPEFGITTGTARRIEGQLVMSGQVEGREGA